MNLSIFTGNLGRDPELRAHNGDNILNFSIGVATGTKDNPETMWVDCALWGKRATSLQPYLFKGSRVTVSGPLKFEKYQAKDGSMESRLRMSVDQIDLPPKGADQSSTAPAQQDAHSQAKANAYQPQPNGGIDGIEDDIPF
jgi:single-strand DNA-binding protein